MPTRFKSTLPHVKIQQVDVHALFKIPPHTPPVPKRSVADLAMEAVSEDLKFVVDPVVQRHTALNARQQRVMHRYYQQNPFAMQAAPQLDASVFPEGLRAHIESLNTTGRATQHRVQVEAISQDLVAHMRVLNKAIGSTARADDEIVAMGRHVGEEQVAQAVHLLNRMQRFVLLQGANQARTMLQRTTDGLWGTSSAAERELKAELQTTRDALDTALALYDGGDTDGAFKLYSRTMGDAQGHYAWFGRALHDSEHRKFAAKIGITMAAGALAFVSGGATLYAMSAAAGAGSTSIAAAYTAQLLVSGTVFTATDMALNAVILNAPAFKESTVIENTAVFVGNSLQNAALFGWMRGFGQVMKGALPVFKGEMAVAVNAIQNFGVEYTGLTSFNAMTSVSHLIDPNRPALFDMISREALLHNLAFLLGMRMGNLGLQSAGSMAKVSAQTLGAIKSTVSEFFSRATEGASIPMPLMLASKVVTPMQWFSAHQGQIPLILVGAFNVNLSFGLALGLRYAANHYFPGLAESFPALFTGEADTSYFSNPRNIIDAWQTTNLFGLGFLVPFFAGYPGSFSSRVSQVRLNPNDFDFAAMDRRQVAQTYLREFALRGIMGTSKLLAIHLGQSKGHAAGLGLDVAANTAGDVTYATMLRTGHTIQELTLPGIIIGAAMGYANTTISQHHQFSHGQQFLHRTLLGVGRSTVYRGLMTSNTLGWGTKLVLAMGYGALAVGYAFKATAPERPEVERVAAEPIAAPPPVTSAAAAAALLASPLLGKSEVTIVVLDSGLGGLSVMADIYNRLAVASPFHRVRLVFANVLPATQNGLDYTGYNDLPRDVQAQVFDRALRALWKDYKPDMLVIACNTLSVIGLRTPFLRENGTYAVNIIHAGVGVMYRAMSTNPTAKLVLMATPATIESGIYQTELRNRSIPDDRVIPLACKGLALAIEQEPHHIGPIITERVAEAAKQLDGHKGPVYVSLNCTHFGYQADAIQAAFKSHGVDVTILNPNAHMMENHLDFKQSGEKIAPEITIVTQYNIQSAAKGDLGKAVARLSEPVAQALINFQRRPDLFSWEDLHPRPPNTVSPAAATTSGVGGALPQLTVPPNAPEKSQ
jgi:glutamate racemase